MSAKSPALDQPESSPDESRPSASPAEPAAGEPAPSPPAEQPSDAGQTLPKRAHLILGLGLPAVFLVVNMWLVRTLTIDDAYISFRYARNLARGLGLVYNAGERVEGYTNFLWTLLLAGCVKIGLDPDVMAKVLGGAFALGALGATYRLSARLSPLSRLPCVATWLFAGSAILSGYAVLGLETLSFIFFVLAGTLLVLDEEDGREALAKEAPLYAADPGSVPPKRGKFPWSGLVFALAGLSRPEAPMFIGVLMLFLGKRIFGRMNLLRGVLFVLPIAAHVLWRHSYYGSWLPNTLSAKTGNLDQQLHGGWKYLNDYLLYAGPALWIAPFALIRGIMGRERGVSAVAALAFLILVYTVLVGGDWMPYFRFLAPFEPFCFVLVCIGVRYIVEKRARTADVVLATVGVALFVQRAGALAEARDRFANDERFWKKAAGQTAEWLNKHERGTIAIGDIGFVGYSTDYPLLDLLGLVDPVISKLPGGYTRKVGAGYTNRFFEVAPRYALLISSNATCTAPSVPTSQAVYRDGRFRTMYQVSGKVTLDGGGATWCIFERTKAAAPPTPEPRR